MFILIIRTEKKILYFSIFTKMLYDDTRTISLNSSFFIIRVLEAHVIIEIQQ